jgi:hypothetical protein
MGDNATPALPITLIGIAANLPAKLLKYSKKIVDLIST